MSPGFLVRLLAFAASLMAMGASLSVATPAPAFRISDLEGHSFDLSSRRGEVVLLNFWATWCVPCLSELEAFRGLQSEYTPRGFTVLAVSVDQPQTLARVRSFARARNFPFPVLLDPDEAVYRAYGGAVMPTSVLIDREGRIIHRKEGYQPGDDDDWRRRIEEALGPLSQAVVPSPETRLTEHSTPDPSRPSHPSIPSELSRAVDPKSSSVTDPVRISGSNFLRGNYGREVRGQPEANGWLEDWFDFRVGNDRLAYQSRYRVYQFLRDLPDTRENLVRNPNHRIVKQTVTYTDEHADIRAGNFYGTLNRGLVLRMFEDRQARIDRDVNGVWASLKSGNEAAGWGRGRVSVLGGSTYSRFDDLYAMDADDELRDTKLQGVEGEWEPRTGLILGAQALEAFRESWHVRLAGGNAEWRRGSTSAYAGYVGLEGQDAFNYPADFTGRALYAAFSQNLGALELGLEYKYYHNYDLGFVEPPSLVPFHTFRLTARDMPFPNNQHEEGVQARGAWTFTQGARYAVNVSHIISHPERNPTYLVHHEELPYFDVDQSLHLEGPEGGHLLLGVNFNDRRQFESGVFEDSRAVTVGATGTKPLQGPWSIQGDVEVQKRWVSISPATSPNPIGGVGSVAARGAPWLGVMSATLGRASAWNLTLDYEATTAIGERDPDSVHDKIPGLSNGWVSAQFTLLAIEGHTIALWGGQRKERVVCSGGSCRVEPAFEGGELTWSTHF